jgi:hypothetical protein
MEDENSQHRELEVEETGEGGEDNKQEPEKEDVRAENKKLLPYFLEERIKLRAVAYLPVMVSFYKLLCESFAYKITEEEADMMSVPACIELLENEGQQHNDLVSLLRKVWEDFKTAWRGILLFIILLSYNSAVLCICLINYYTLEK